MQKLIIIKYGELTTKKDNINFFLKALKKNVEDALSNIDHTTTYDASRMFIKTTDFDKTIEKLKCVFGIYKMTIAYELSNEMDAIKEGLISLLKDKDFKTFKVVVKRSYKKYPGSSMEIASTLGGHILKNIQDKKVDVHNPDVEINVEIRNHINIYSKIIPGPGGMPVGTAGKAMLLLSGGIDSPVAGWMTAKRGVVVDAVYFHAPPYTSERAKQKVVDLAKLVSKYSGPMRLYVVNFTEIQMYIYDKCPHDELTIIMRRYMMKIAEYFANKEKAQGLITGESIGQVASQTLQSLASTNEVCTLPVYRPVIGFDKEEIVRISRKIDTFETSIQPFEDCCTIFVAKHPVTKPNLKVIRRSEQKLSEKIDELMETALNTTEIIEIQ